MFEFCKLIIIIVVVLTAFILGCDNGLEKIFSTINLSFTDAKSSDSESYSNFVLKLEVVEIQFEKSNGGWIIAKEDYRGIGVDIPLKQGENSSSILCQGENGGFKSVKVLFNIAIILKPDGSFVDIFPEDKSVENFTALGFFEIPLTKNITIDINSKGWLSIKDNKVSLKDYIGSGSKII